MTQSGGNEGDVNNGEPELPPSAPPPAPARKRKKADPQDEFDPIPGSSKSGVSRSRFVAHYRLTLPQRQGKATKATAEDSDVPTRSSKRTQKRREVSGSDDDSDGQSRSNKRKVSGQEHWPTSQAVVSSQKSASLGRSDLEVTSTLEQLQDGVMNTVFALDVQRLTTEVFVQSNLSNIGLLMTLAYGQPVSHSPRQS